MFRRSNKFKRHRYTLGLMLLACFVIVLFSIIPSSNVEEDFDGEGYEDGEEPDTMFENVDDEPDVVTAEHAQPVSKEGILELQSQISHLKDEIKELTERVGKSELDLVRAEEARLSTPQTSAPTTAPTQQTSSYSSTTQSGYSSSTSGYSSTTGGYSSSSQGSSGLSSGLSSGASSGQCPLVFIPSLLLSFFLSFFFPLFSFSFLLITFLSLNNFIFFNQNNRVNNFQINVVHV